MRIFLARVQNILTQSFHSVFGVSFNISAWYFQPFVWSLLLHHQQNGLRDVDAIQIMRILYKFWVDLWDILFPIFLDVPSINHLEYHLKLSCSIRVDNLYHYRHFLLIIYFTSIKFYAWPPFLIINSFLEIMRYHSYF